MNIWVDADACPVVIRDILCKAAHRTQTPTCFIANHGIRLPPSPFLRFVQVESGFDVADNWIAQQVSTDDLVVTSDIPLAADVIERGALALSVRGEIYTTENIRARLNMRDFMDTLRNSGVDTGGSAPFSQADRQTFANQLDRWLSKKTRS